jgi:hypothetical protein
MEDRIRLVTPTEEGYWAALVKAERTWADG